MKIVGTSTCDCAVAPAADRIADIPGICGIVNGSIMPGYYGIEAGQSAVGDILKWWVETVCRGGDALHDELSREAAALEPGQAGLLALDWNNGNRTVLVDPQLRIRGYYDTDPEGLDEVFHRAQHVLKEARPAQ